MGDGREGKVKRKKGEGRLERGKEWRNVSLKILTLAILFRPCKSTYFLLVHLFSCLAEVDL